MSKTRFFWGFLVMLLFVSLIVLLNETIVITEPQLQLTLSKYYFLGGVFGLFVFFVFILVFNKNKAFVNWKVFLLLALGYAGPIVAAFMQPSTITLIATDNEGVAQTVTLVIGYYARFQSIFFAGTSLLVTYLFFVVVPKLIASKKFLMGFLYFLVIILFGLVIYSVVVEWDQYYLLFSTGDIDYYTPTISLFSNTNVFGYYMSLGIFAMGILESLKHRFWHSIVLMIFFITLLLTITITSYFGSLVFLTLYIIHDLRTQFKEHPLSASIWLVSLGTLAFFTIVGLMLSNEPFALSLREDFIPESTESLQSRFVIWRYARELFFGFAIFIGHGFGISNSLLQATMAINSSNPTNRFHNGWYDVMATGGIWGMAFYIILIIVVAVIIVKRMKNNSRVATTALFILIGILVQSLAEAKVLFKADAMGTLGTFLILIPVLMKPELLDQKIIVTPIPKVFDIFRQ